jgi:hypothetical protein
MPDIGRVEPQPPPDSLQHLEILFEQGLDGKDGDTAVLLELLARDNRLLATYYHAQFPDHEYPASGYAYERLDIQGTVSPNDTVGSHLRIKITRTGNDHWEFAWHLLLGGLREACYMVQGSLPRWALELRKVTSLPGKLIYSLRRRATTSRITAGPKRFVQSTMLFPYLYCHDTLAILADPKRHL